MIPEKWYIKVTSENKPTLNKWRSAGYLNSASGFLVSSYGEGNRGYWFEYLADIPHEFLELEITFDQFKEFVLKEPPKVKPEVSLFNI